MKQPALFCPIVRALDRRKPLSLFPVFMLQAKLVAFWLQPYTSTLEWNKIYFILAKKQIHAFFNMSKADLFRFRNITSLSHDSRAREFVCWIASTQHAQLSFRPPALFPQGCLNSCGPLYNKDGILKDCSPRRGSWIIPQSWLHRDRFPRF